MTESLCDACQLVDTEYCNYCEPELMEMCQFAVHATKDDVAALRKELEIVRDADSERCAEVERLRKRIREDYPGVGLKAIADAIREPMECGHHVDCLDDETGECQWCANRKTMRRLISEKIENLKNLKMLSDRLESIEADVEGLAKVKAERDLYQKVALTMGAEIRRYRNKSFGYAADAADRSASDIVEEFIRSVRIVEEMFITLDDPSTP